MLSFSMLESIGIMDALHRIGISYGIYYIHIDFPITDANKDKDRDMVQEGQLIFISATDVDTVQIRIQTGYIRIHLHPYF